MLDSDDPVVTDLLAGLLEILADTGGWLHPSARLVSRGGELSVHCAAAEGEPLMRVPREALVRVNRVQWALADGRLAAPALDDGLGDAEIQALFLMIGLLNQCNKLAALSRHPLLADLSPRLVSALRAFRSSFGSARPDPVSLLWSTRCFRVDFGDGPEPVAAPLLELMNHRVGGAVALPEGGGLSAHGVRFEGDECFLDYGQSRDAISMAIVYGFADSSATHAHSAPVRVHVPGVGEIAVTGRGRGSDGSLLPVTVRNRDGFTEISRLTFPGPVPAEVSESMFAGVRDANLALLDELLAAADADGSAAARMLADAAGIQRAIVAGAIWTPTTVHGAEGVHNAISEDDLDLRAWIRA